MSAHLRPSHRRQLWPTLDSFSERLFFKKSIPVAQRKAVARWIASRQGLPGSYADMFAPTQRDLCGVRLFTGEPVRSRVGVAHILGEESCRILVLLQVNDQPVQEALNRALQGFARRLTESEQHGYHLGTYCCGTCSVAYWRNLALHLWPQSEDRLRQGLVELSRLRKGDGRWRRFPFHYTCLALTEIGPDLARAEMQYAAAYWRKNLKKLAAAEGGINRRRAAVGRRLLEMCDA
jgi:hypothetical protein